jgi:uncharacterized metal-binding protein
MIITSASMAAVLALGFISSILLWTMVLTTAVLAILSMVNAVVFSTIIRTQRAVTISKSYALTLAIGLALGVAELCLVALVRDSIGLGGLAY